VAYHEAFWVVTGTAAPVIALAVIVSAQNASVTAREAQIRLVVGGQSPGRGPGPDFSEELRRAVRVAKKRKTLRHVVGGQPPGRGPGPDFSEELRRAVRLAKKGKTLRHVVKSQSPGRKPDLTEDLRQAVRQAKARKAFRHLTASYRAALVNLTLQSALLAISLVSIDSAANCVPPWLAIILAVGGIFLLAVISQATGYAVRLFKDE
jgi:hypothetical protein